MNLGGVHLSSFHYCLKNSSRISQWRKRVSQKCAIYTYQKMYQHNRLQGIKKNSENPKMQCSSSLAIIWKLLFCRQSYRNKAHKKSMKNKQVKGILTLFLPESWIIKSNWKSKRKLWNRNKWKVREFWEMCCIDFLKFCWSSDNTFSNFDMFLTKAVHTFHNGKTCCILKTCLSNGMV